MFSLEIDLKLSEELNKKTLSNLKNKQQKNILFSINK